MKKTHLTGLGEPDVTGKRSLFQPPVASNNVNQESDSKQVTVSPEQGRTVETEQKAKKPVAPVRVHITTDLTLDALRVIQSIQDDYRLKRGRVLPQWKAFSRAIEYYGKARLKDRAA